MHHLDLGLFHYQIEYTKKFLAEQRGKSLSSKIDHRLAAIPRFPGLKIFSNGIQSIARLTANEYRNLMKVMIFVVDNLYEDNDGIENFVKNENLAKLYETWNEMYAISRYETFKESDLVKFRVGTSLLYKNSSCLLMLKIIKFQESINEWSQMFVRTFKHMSPSELKLPKLHSWVYHIIDSIRSFGAVNGYTTETYESLHKEYVKNPYRLSNKKNIEIQIMQIASIKYL